jgi:hypothetical protein
MMAIMFDIENKVYPYPLVAFRWGAILGHASIFEALVVIELLHLECSRILPSSVSVLDIKAYGFSIVPRNWISKFVPWCSTI